MPTQGTIDLHVYTDWPAGEHVNDLIQRLLRKHYDQAELERIAYTDRDIVIHCRGVGNHEDRATGMFGVTDTLAAWWRIEALREDGCMVVVDLEY